NQVGSLFGDTPGLEPGPVTTSPAAEPGFPELTGPEPFDAGSVFAAGAPQGLEGGTQANIGMLGAPGEAAAETGTEAATEAAATAPGLTGGQWAAVAAPALSALAIGAMTGSTAQAGKAAVHAAPLAAGFLVGGPVGSLVMGGLDFLAENYLHSPS